jgi:hypothetical protein
MRKSQQTVNKHLTEQGTATLVALAGVAVGIIAVLLVWLVVLTMNKADPVQDTGAPVRDDASAPAPVSAPPVAAPTRTVTVAPQPSAAVARPVTCGGCRVGCSAGI